MSFTGRAAIPKEATQGIDFVRDKYKAAKIQVGADEATKDIEVAVAKATNHDEVSPKEKHVRTLILACGAGEPRRQVQLIVHKLEKRAHNDHGWLVTLKCLMTFHRLMRETDISFMEEMLTYSDRTGHRGVLRLDSYKDVTTQDAWDYSSWIRVFSSYLDERLDLYRVMKFDIQTEKSTTVNRLRDMGSERLLDILPRMQRAQTQLTGCIPEGSAKGNPVVMDALLLILKESFRLYHAISEGVICLVDRFFDMDRVKAQQATEMYKSAIDGTDAMTRFYNHIKGLDGISHSVNFPDLTPPPYDFLSQMEEYVRSAPVEGDASDSYSPVQRRSRQAAVSSPALMHAKQSPGTMPAGASSSVSAAPAPEDLLRDLDIIDQVPPAGNSASADPFGDSAWGGSQPASDPFASMAAGSSSANAFQASPDPFAAVAAGAAADPFGAPSNPFSSENGTNNANPFGGSPSSLGAAGDPFGAKASSPAPVFAATAAPVQNLQPDFGNPFGGPSASSDPFGVGGFAPASADPFGGYSATASDPFALPAPYGGAGAAFGALPVMPSSQSSIRAPVAAPKSPPNPFASSGLQQHMLSNQSRKSVADPFSALNVLSPQKGQTTAAPAGTAPMRPSQNAPKASWNAPASSSDPFGSDPFGGNNLL